MLEKEAQKKALNYMRQAQADGYHAQSMICDRAVIALGSDGYTSEQAQAAVNVVWERHFAVHGPV